MLMRVRAKEWNQTSKAKLTWKKLGKTKNTCIEEPSELGKVARNKSWMGGRDKDRVENWTIIFEFNLWCYGHLANTKKDRK